MFTGLIEATGRVAALTPGHGATGLEIVSPWPTADLADGESIAVDGVCLTVAGRTEDRFRADVVAETLARTTLGRLAPDQRVNLERSLRLGDRLGGHLVSGHVDLVAQVLGVAGQGADHRVRVTLPEPIRHLVAYKGSIALGGVSLTVAALGPDWLEVALVPETLARTTLGALVPGDPLNVEVDLLARYLERLYRAQGSTDP